MRGIASLFTQSVSVATKLGDGALGPVYGDPVTKSCFINDKRQIVRNAQGAEVVSETTIYAPLTDYDAFPVGSKVDVDGRTAHVLAVYRRDSAGPVSAHHTQVTLT